MEGIVEAVHRNASHTLREEKGIESDYWQCCPTIG